MLPTLSCPEIGCAPSCLMWNHGRKCNQFQPVKVEQYPPIVSYSRKIVSLVCWRRPSHHGITGFNVCSDLQPDPLPNTPRVTTRVDTGPDFRQPYGKPALQLGRRVLSYDDKIPPSAGSSSIAGPIASGAASGTDKSPVLSTSSIPEMIFDISHHPRAAWAMSRRQKRGHCLGRMDAVPVLPYNRYCRVRRGGPAPNMHLPSAVRSFPRVVVAPLLRLLEASLHDCSLPNRPPGLRVRL